MAWTSYNVWSFCMSSKGWLGKKAFGTMEKALEYIDKKCAERAESDKRDKLVDIAYTVVKSGVNVDLPDNQSYISINRDWTGEKHFYPNSFSIN